MPLSTSILLTGVTGQIGGDLLPLLQARGTIIAPARPELDLSNAPAIRRLIHRAKPDWIINPAAYTAVDKSESEPQLAYAINAEAPRALGEAAAELGIPVIHFSTDYVFNGAGTVPWTETDATGPLGVYGASKLAGEQALAETGAVHFIFRTSWVYSSRGKNFLRTILRRAQEKEELRIVDDQHGAPTWSQDLARMVVHVMGGIHEQSALTGTSIPETVRSVGGIYHAADGGETTWFGFAKEILRLTSVTHPDLKLARLVPIASRDYPAPASRPANSRLNCQRLREAFRFTMPTWQESAAAVVSEVFKGLAP